ncbi:aspartyl-phosphate phosphatase Spo0E family protein [Paenibacillus flagellatus]|uniref:Aspartyl-phosphate phosphatase Spo0E family protein n=2 Tax=Paenibacillus flagellatus TaxID=2211139 RepID=A0A2V5KD64_9BACL|nr:aspartyl-phosphate phosphatase Spo0E family protein [Paenibacillus flagellatus]
MLLDGGVTEPVRTVHWPHRVRRKSRSGAAVAAVSLEDEITSLRRKMEDAFLECESLTSDPVVAISRMLDAKINEYMKVSCKD